MYTATTFLNQAKVQAVVYYNNENIPTATSANSCKLTSTTN